MFSVRTIHPEEKRVETAAFDLAPPLEQGQKICELFGDFLAHRPAEFRERIPFLNRTELELQWAAASGGAAFYAFFHGGEAVSMGVLVSGANADSDAQMLDAWRGIAHPILGNEQLLDAPERPLMMTLQMPGYPELVPAVQLLSTALASVYFRAILALANLRDDTLEHSR